MSAATSEEALRTIARRSRTTLRDRVRRLRGGGVLVLQTGLAAGLAWYVADDLIGHPYPFFAPIAAIIALGASLGQRTRRIVELVIGVAVGILVGDLTVAWVGTGPVQVGAIIALAMVAAIVLGGGALLVTQAAVSGALVATFSPSTGGAYPDRVIDALIGGAAAFVIHALLLPLNPVTAVNRAVRPVFDALASSMEGLAEALRRRDADAAAGISDRLVGRDPALARFHEAIDIGREVASVAPVRWRTRSQVAVWVAGAADLDRAVRDARVLARRAVTLIRDAEPVPDTLPEALSQVGSAARWLYREIADGEPPDAARGRALSGVRDAAAAYASGLGLSGGVVVAQLRSVVDDLLRASGLTEREARREIRRAVNHASPPAARR